MEAKETYVKKDAQIQLESILYFIETEGLKISELKTLPGYASVSHKFDESLVKVIENLLQEEVTHDMIASIATSYFSQYYDRTRKTGYDKEYDYYEVGDHAGEHNKEYSKSNNYAGEYDTFCEVESDIQVGLYSVISKRAGKIDNTGRIKIDTLLDRGPEYFVRELRKYIQNGIIKDSRKKHTKEQEHFVYSTFPSDDNGNSCDLYDSVEYNSRCFEDSVNPIDDLICRLSFDPDTCFRIINAIITRFMKKKPVAAYNLLCIINAEFEKPKHKYNVLEVVSDLKTKDFNCLFHRVLEKIEKNVGIDLSLYANHVFTADKYIESLSKKNEIEARNRIDRLASQTRKDVFNLRPIKAALSDYPDIGVKYRRKK